MNGPLDERSLRKQLLVARSNLHRLEVRKEVLNIVDGLNLSSLGGNGGSGSLRSWLLDLFMRRVASAPVARLLGLLSGLVSFAQIVRIGTAITRKASSSRPEA
ncbi:MAG TPA: hypothetical protein VF678_03065, partial [bacterium]